MSTAPDTPASIPEHLLETITDGMDFREVQGWIPWAWGVLARAGDVPAQIDEDDPDYPRSLMALAALGRLYDLFQQVLSGLSADLETNPDLVGEVRPTITTIELARYSEAEGVFDTVWPETGSGLLREAIRTRTDQISARLVELLGTARLFTSLFVTGTAAIAMDDDTDVPADTHSPSEDAFDRYLASVVNDDPTVDKQRTYEWLNGDLDLS
ncbi:hypothetical protein [Kocuria rhizophila]|uniref:hypothetical protein n=1 Tax=Kocuria rhizophila TaxID=72000 RepID=UPI002019DBA7|nr:hypothetical protein [Kocuria rhizophila]